MIMTLPGSISLLRLFAAVMTLASLVTPMPLLLLFTVPAAAAVITENVVIDPNTGVVIGQPGLPILQFPTLNLPTAVTLNAGDELHLIVSFNGAIQVTKDPAINHNNGVQVVVGPALATTGPLLTSTLTLTGVTGSINTTTATETTVCNCLIGDIPSSGDLTSSTFSFTGFELDVTLLQSPPTSSSPNFFNASNFSFSVDYADTIALLARAYITNSGDGTVSVIDTTNNTVVETIPVGRKPFGVAVTPDGSKVYIANSGDNTVSVIETATNTVTGSPIAVGTDPVGVAVTPDGKTVYVTNQGDDTVSVINTATNTVIGSAIDVGCTNCGRKTTNLPTGIAVTPDGSKVYVGNLGAPGYASVIATASNTVTTINTKKVTTGVAVTPDGSKVYLGCIEGAVLAINVATNRLGHGSTIGVGSGSEGVAVTPDGSKVYVADSAAGTVSVINTGTNKVVGSIAVGSDPQGVSVTSDGSKVYVANEGGGTVSIIDTATNTAESSTITVGKAPLALGIFIPPPKPTK
jgi:YVTN family beta-propeller protein